MLAATHRRAILRLSTGSRSGLFLYTNHYENNTASKNFRVAKPNKEKPVLLSKLVVSDSKKSRFIKAREASQLLSSLKIRSHLSQVKNIL